jgi:hypothetical protein
LAQLWRFKTINGEVNSGVRYHYYVSHALLQNRKTEAPFTIQHDDTRPDGEFA